MTQLRLQPSVLDRLDPVAGAIRWWTSQIVTLFGAAPRKTIAVEDLEHNTKRLHAKVAIALGETDGFVATTRLPKGSADAHRQALGLRIDDIAPTTPATLSMTGAAVARDADGSLTYAVMMARKERLTQIEAIARRKGARDVIFTSGNAGDLELRSPAAERKAQQALLVDAAIVLAIIVSTMIAVSVWTTRIEAETEMLAGEERSLRRAAVAAETTRNAAGVSAQLIERGLLSRRADAALRTLAMLNEATPDQAWWTRVRWTPQETTLSGQATDATAAIGQMSDRAKAWSIELTGPLNAAPSGGYQSFELIARERKTPTP
jgi:hypothetical protein